MPKPEGLYIHVPFCRKKCGYCDFYSVPGTQEDYDRYTDQVCQMLLDCPFGSRVFDTVYFGGGTPSLLGARNIDRILQAAASRHTLTGREITLEANPNTVDGAFFGDIHRSGVNRVSMGLQAAQPLLLHTLGRSHTPGDVTRAVELARGAGIENISLDVMLSLPGQTLEDILQTLQFCIELEVPHISAYLLKIEEGTPFDCQDVRGLCPDEDLQSEHYYRMVCFLEHHGLLQYEISNFSRPGFESQHNLGYWKLVPYLGLGPAAHSFLDGKRFHFERDLPAFLAAKDPWSLRQDDGPGGDFTEFAMLRLRLREGLNLDEAQAYYGVDKEQFLFRAQRFIPLGLVQQSGSSLRLTPRGFLLSNPLIARLLGD
ncbi:radical SAM family heme chaperone HemW [Harryflintia acetispora]|uniref:Heme chaperone HemW n=1 Tax=Harryflintia acetispora TaxID=1849041 RepID=A0A9X8ULD6_9FIRM|nr:radical SAM family heme chaperone HemW [Harryflintia acetispora]RGB68936.1 radical SAM family heme chaperone HemW [Harryflintia acetispora]TCL45206.1 oxygen-independent coproporphyrinogen-3 oxidase [Harryflintia acetispora]